MWPAIIGAVGSLAGSAMNNSASASAADTAFGRQKELMALQQQYAVDNWNREVNYNSPKEQMKRLKEAGLNPNLVYGNGASGLQAGPIAAPTAPSAPMQVTAPGNFGSAVSDAVNAAVGIAQAKKAKSETIAQNIENEYLTKTLKDRVRAVGLANDWTEQDMRKMDQEIANYSNQWSLWQNQIDQMRKNNQLTDKQISWYDRHMSAEIADLKASKEYKTAMSKLTDQEREQAEQLFDSMKRISEAQAGLAEKALDIAKTYGDAQAIIGMVTQIVSSGSQLLGVLLKKTPAGMVINNLMPSGNK